MDGRERNGNILRVDAVEKPATDTMKASTVPRLLTSTSTNHARFDWNARADIAERVAILSQLKHF
jgi:hypothetical protein